MKITYLHQYFNIPDMPGGTRSYEMARRLVAMGIVEYYKAIMYKDLGVIYES